MSQVTAGDFVTVDFDNMDDEAKACCVDCTKGKTYQVGIVMMGTNKQTFEQEQVAVFRDDVGEFVGIGLHEVKLVQKGGTSHVLNDFFDA